MTETVVRPAGEPVVAWRYWQLLPGGVVLRSVTQKSVGWPPGRPLRAVCRGVGHPAPAEGCGCGIYGSETLEALREHPLCLAPGVLLVGRVALWGRVVADGHGYRGEHAYPAELLAVRDTVADDSLDAVLEGLRAYGVAVGVTGLDQAVGDVSGTILAFQAMSGGTAVP